MADSRLIVLLRAPRLGTVKTRLAAVLGPDAALAAYRQLLGATLRSVATLPDVELRCTPDDAAAEVRALALPGWTVNPQGGGSLGERLHRAFADGFAGGAERLAVIGSDCPDLTAVDIQSAWDALDQHDVVLGPATDGGYWLIALSAPQPALFEAIDWGGPTVLQQTLDRAAGNHLRVHRLRALSDVDTVEDWKRHAPNLR